jgi:two-component system CheB/CheR fusion protein
MRDAAKPPANNQGPEDVSERLERATGELQRVKGELSALNERLGRQDEELKQLIAAADDARAEAGRANGTRDDFLATLSHELRTPLASMLLNAQRLRSGAVRDEATLQRIGASLERATTAQAQLIDDLLDVSRGVAGTLTIEPCAVDLCATVRAAVETVSTVMAAKALALEMSLEQPCAPIWAEPARVLRVVKCLLSNAIKFTPSGGRIAISVTASAGLARLCVADSGIGIDDGFLPHLYAPFSQRDSSITRKYGGLGLGLALVRQIVELHGGTVHVESAGQSKGTQSFVTFPLVGPSHVALQAPPPLPGAHALDRPGRAQHYDELAGLRVLFVDDDLRTREAVLEVLQLTGIHVKLAASAAEGLLAIDSFKPDVVLCDIAMPEEDGYTFMRRLRTREAEGVPIPAMAFTALATDEDRRRALAAGFQLHMAKPIDIDRLRKAVLELSRLAPKWSAQRGQLER